MRVQSFGGLEDAKTEVTWSHLWNKLKAVLQHLTETERVTIVEAGVWLK